MKIKTKVHGGLVASSPSLPGGGGGGRGCG